MYLDGEDKANALNNFKQKRNKHREEKIKEKENAEKQNDSKKTKERAGDWTCVRCENHNYSFRDYCNKCGLSKVEHEWMQINQYDPNKIFE